MRLLGRLLLLLLLGLLASSAGAGAAASESQGNQGNREELWRLYEAYLEEHGKQVRAVECPNLKSSHADGCDTAVVHVSIEKSNQKSTPPVPATPPPKPTQGLHLDAAAWEAGLQQFERTEALIQASNNGGKITRSFSLRHSRFSDMGEAERAAFFWKPHPDAAHFLLDASLRMTAEEEAALLILGGWGKGKAGDGVEQEGKEELPASVNWATEDNPLGRSVVTPPINQGHCGM